MFKPDAVSIVIENVDTTNDNDKTRNYLGSQKFAEYVDKAVEEENSDACVIMCMAITSRWKISVAYYLINSLNVPKGAAMIINVWYELDKTGVHLISSTFDATATNFPMANNILDASVSDK